MKKLLMFFTLLLPLFAQAAEKHPMKKKVVYEYQLHPISKTKGFEQTEIYVPMNKKQQEVERDIQKRFPLLSQIPIDGQPFGYAWSLSGPFDYGEISGDEMLKIGNIRDDLVERVYKIIVSGLHARAISPNILDEFKDFLHVNEEHISRDTWGPLLTKIDQLKLGSIGEYQLPQLKHQPKFYVAWYSSSTPREKGQVLTFLLATLREIKRTNPKQITAGIIDEVRAFLKRHGMEVSDFAREQAHDALDELEKGVKAG